ncbi:hypothetical protein TNCV_2210101 [Trichonephila clavipes]|nr:hypothetical protein TNCV_2210101 [Trichonephila clavipes]
MKRPSVYINIITEFISLLNSDQRYACLQQDGATCHTSRGSTEVLAEFFDDRVISKVLKATTFTGLVYSGFFPLGRSEKCRLQG